MRYRHNNYIQLRQKKRTTVSNSGFAYNLFVKERKVYNYEKVVASMLLLMSCLYVSITLFCFFPKHKTFISYPFEVRKNIAGQGKYILVFTL